MVTKSEGRAWLVKETKRAEKREAKGGRGGAPPAGPKGGRPPEGLGQPASAMNEAERSSEATLARKRQDKNHREKSEAIPKENKPAACHPTKVGPTLQAAASGSTWVD